jgi:CheY-like chemotaxis protein
MENRQLKRILLVEDAPDIQMVTRVALEKLGGFEVEVCGSGGEAIEKAPSFAPDLILLDVMMPEMDGPSTLANLRKLPTVSEVPIVFITAKAGQEDLERFQEMGALDVIFKPFDPNMLAATILALWEKAQQ